MSLKIDATDPNNLSNKVLDERTSRMRMYSDAVRMGCGEEMKALFKKYDGLLSRCTNDKERSDIAHLGIMEIYMLLGGGGELYVNNKLVYKESK